MIITLAGATATKHLGGLNFYSIIVNKSSGVTVTLDKTTVDKASASSTTVTGTLTVADGYTLSSVAITMGGTDITSSCYTESTGAISISGITGNVVITAKATSDSGEDNGDIPVELTVYKTPTDTDGVFIMDYNGAFTIQANDTAKTKIMQIVAVDVSSIVGRTLSITATQAVIDGAYYSMFTNTLAGGYSLDSLSSMTRSSLPETATGGRKCSLDRSIIVEEFAVSSTSYATNTIQMVVPNNAKYLYVTNIRESQTEEPNVELM